MQIPQPVSQRDQGLAFAVVLAIAGIGLYWYFLWNPKKADLAVIQQRVDTLTVLNESAQREIARGTATKTREEAEQYGRMLALMRTLVPVQNEVAALIDQLSTTARQAGLELGGIQAPTIINGDVFDTHKYKMSVVGPYHRITQFLTGIGSMSRIVAPTNVQLAATKRPANTLRPDAGEFILDANFEIQTYVAKSRGQ